MTAKERNNTRITARTSMHVYKTLCQAANILGSNLNQFLVQSAVEKANVVLEQERIISLTEKDATLFFNHISNPKKPNSKFKKALTRYKESDLYAQGGAA